MKRRQSRCKRVRRRARTGVSPYFSSSRVSSLTHALARSNTPRRAQIDDYDPFDRDARARNITSTFSAAHIPLDQLQHPTKSQVKAVEAYDLLPDSDLWANEYDLIRFGEDPGDKGLVRISPLSLSCPFSLSFILSLTSITSAERAPPPRTRSSSPPRYLPRPHRSSRRGPCARVALLPAR